MKKSVRLDEKGYRRFGIRDKFAYAAGDFGCNMSFALKTYLTIFWTQYMGIDEFVMAGLLVLVQVWDAINDPVIGGMIDADRRQYKRNKFLQYIWIGSIGLMIAGAGCFIPWKGAPAMVKNILFVAGYILWDAFYTIANVPYGSMMSLITTNSGERAQLSTWRSVGSMGGTMLTTALIPMLVFDAANDLRGDNLFIIALFMGLLGFIAFQFMIRNTVVRAETSVTLKEDAPKFNVFKAVGNFAKNRAILGVTFAAVAQLCGYYAAATANTYLWQSYFQNAKVSGVMSILSMVGMFVWMPFVQKAVDKFGKKELLTFAMAWSTAAYGLMIILPISPDSTGMWMYVALSVLNTLGSGISSCITWSLVADAIDYNEWKNGVRDEGTTYALYSFFRKLAQGVGPSLGLIACTLIGYNADLGAAQPMEVATGLRYLVPAVYMIAAALQLLGYGLVYNLNKKTLAKVQADLSERK